MEDPKPEVVEQVVEQQENEPKEEEAHVRKPIIPTTNVLNISSKKNARFWMFLCKLYLKQFEEVELHSFGDGISICVRIAENIKRFGYADITKIETQTKNVEVKNKNTGKTRQLKRANLFVLLKRSDNFDQLVENLNFKQDEGENQNID